MPVLRRVRSCGDGRGQRRLVSGGEGPGAARAGPASSRAVDEVLGCEDGGWDGMASPARTGCSSRSGGAFNWESVPQAVRTPEREVPAIPYLDGCSRAAPSLRRGVGTPPQRQCPRQRQRLGAGSGQTPAPAASL